MPLAARWCRHALLFNSSARPAPSWTRPQVRAYLSADMPAFRELRRCLTRRRSSFEPCLPRPAKVPPTGPDWIHEIKHDGFRIIGQGLIIHVADLHLIPTKIFEARGEVCLFGRSSCYYRGVKGRVDLFLSVVAATATALLLALIARDDIGMPPGMVREDALIAASIMVAVIAGISWRKPKQKL
jgi:hypothetical protein